MTCIFTANQPKYLPFTFYDVKLFATLFDFCNFLTCSPQTQAGVVTGSGGSPFLLMAIRDGHGINGEVVQSASVGQRITLDVVMQDTSSLSLQTCCSKLL